MNQWQLTLDRFYAGYAPLAFKDPLTELGSSGHSSRMKNVDILDGKIRQGKKLTPLTNGTEDGVAGYITYIMDRAVDDEEGYALGSKKPGMTVESKLYKITPNEVVDDSDFPREISNMLEGESLAYLKGVLYYFYNTATQGDIGAYDLDDDFQDTWASSAGFDLEKAPHPVATKEDIMVFGNGRYLGVYIQGSDELDPQRLDFGEKAEVADVIFANNSWYIAVNNDVDGRGESQIYIYEAGAMQNVLSDETGVGLQRIGFMMRIDGIVWVACEDLSEEGFIIGYIAGSQIIPMGRYNGPLPRHNQKTLYRKTILFLSNHAYSAGATVNEFPFQLSQIAPGKEDIESPGEHLGAVAAPFGTPIISWSSEDTERHKIAKFDGYTKDAEWESIVFDRVEGFNLSKIDKIIVSTDLAHEDAEVELKILADQETKESNPIILTGGKTRHYIQSIDLPNIEDFKLQIKWNNEHVFTIRKILIIGHNTSG